MLINRHSRTIVALAAALACALIPLHAAMAGQTDLDLFSGSGNLAPNILIMLDSSGSMGDPASGGGGNKVDIAAAALTTLITTVNPPDGSGGYTENARFGLFNFRPHGGLLVTPLGNGNTAAVLAGIAAQAPGGYTPLGGAALDLDG
jgi:hypothetical protein